MSEKNTFGKVTLYRFEDSPASGDEPIYFDGFEAVKWGEETVSGRRLRYALLFLNRAQPKPASWYRGFRPLLAGVEHEVPRILLPGFILLVHTGESLYAFTGGLGFAPVRKQQIVGHFGLTLARKLIGEAELRGLSQKDTGGNVNHLDRAFRRGYSPIGDSGNLKRILTHLRATVSDQNPRFQSIGKTIEAGDALTVKGKKTFAELLQFVVTVDDLWNANVPLLSIPQLEEINKKRSKQLINSLNDAIVAKLASYSPEDDSFFIDNEDIGYLPDRVYAYQLLLGGVAPTAHPSSEGLFEELRDALLSMATPALQQALLAGLKVRLSFDDEHREDVFIKDYICGDITYDNEVYFIHQGSWYHATDEYLEAIERELNEVPYMSAEELGLTPWDTSVHRIEKEYNQAQTALVVLDTLLVRLDRELGGIEFCDLLLEQSGEFRLVHVKQAHGAELRALFAQGEVASRYYAHSGQFRQKVCSGEMQGMPDPKPAEKLDALMRLTDVPRHRLCIVFAIFDQTPSHRAPDTPAKTSQMLKGTLSAFAKVDLLTRVESLRSMGYKVAVTRIRPYPVLNQNAA